MAEKSAEQMYNERLDRLLKAVAHEKTDRTPINLVGPCFIKFGEPSAVLADFIRRPEWADDVIVKAYVSMPDIDCGGGGAVGNMASMGARWMSRTKLPGRELSEDTLWQIDEAGAMTVEDYDTIIDRGWKTFQLDYQINRLGYKPEELAPNVEAMEKSAKKFKDIGLVSMRGMFTGMPYDQLCGGRGVANFTKDLYRIPDKVKAALDVILEENAGDAGEYFRSNKALTGGIAPSVRANCDFVSRKVFEKFAWPLFQRFTNVVLDGGAIPSFHQDSRWDDFLDYFTEFPKNRCIYDLDEMTDIYKVKEILGDRMCITGNVSSGLTCLGTSDEVYDFCRKQISDVGETGYIMNTSCTAPPNAKLENIKAIIAACTGK